MRQKQRDELETMVHCAVNDALAPHLSRSLVQLAQLDEAIKAVKPVNMDLTQELADDIVTKLHGPLTISPEFSKQLRLIAAHTSVLVTAQFGYGPDAGTLWIEIKPNGTFYLQIKDMFGAPMWQGTFVPPDFGKVNDGDVG